MSILNFTKKKPQKYLNVLLWTHRVWILQNIKSENHTRLIDWTRLFIKKWKKYSVFYVAVSLSNPLSLEEFSCLQGTASARIPIRGWGRGWGGRVRGTLRHSKGHLASCIIVQLNFLKTNFCCCWHKNVGKLAFRATIAESLSLLDSNESCYTLCGWDFLSSLTPYGYLQPCWATLNYSKSG